MLSDLVPMLLVQDESRQVLQLQWVHLHAGNIPATEVFLYTMFACRHMIVCAIPARNACVVMWKTLAAG